jgi:hypothetical protein
MATLQPTPHVPRGTKVAAEEVDLDLRSLHSLGSANGGSRLQIYFPFVENEGVLSPVELSSLPLPGNLIIAAQIENLLSVPEQLYEPDIAPATTEYINRSEDLSNFQALSGDPPALTPDGSWSWNGVGNVTVLTQDLVAANDEQNHIFWSGILFGVAGGGAIALALELIGLGEKLRDSRSQKGANKATQKATPTNEPDH